MQSIDLNADMGESTTLWPWLLEKDLSLLPYISAVNIACGYHAGDAHTIRRLSEAATAAGVAVGAHPGFPDRENFGRSAMHFTQPEIYDMLLYQLAATDALVRAAGNRLVHVKPHGALYNMAALNPELAFTICRAIRDFNPALRVYALSGSCLITVAESLSLTTRSEVFSDRTYTEQGTLTSRSQPGAVIESEDEAIRQVMQMVTTGTVTTPAGSIITVKADTVCVHADGKRALALAKNLHHQLLQHHISVTSQPPA